MSLGSPPTSPPASPRGVYVVEALEEEGPRKVEETANFDLSGKQNEKCAATYHAEEPLHRMHEEEARLKAASILDESPASPSSFNQVPASPVMAPNVSHAIKVIPTLAFPHDVDYRKADTDLRVPPVKEIPLETVIDKTVDGKVADADPTSVKLEVKDELRRAENEDVVFSSFDELIAHLDVLTNVTHVSNTANMNLTVHVLNVSYETFLSKVTVIGDIETNLTYSNR